MVDIAASHLVPTITSYGGYKQSSGSTINCLLLTVGSLRVYYSYRTPIAFYDVNNNLIVRENEWGPMTAKHISWLPKTDLPQLPSAQFDAALVKHMENYNGFTRNPNT